MIRSGVVKDDKTIELKVSMSFEVGQRVSLAIFPYDEDRAGSPEAILEAVGAIESDSDNGRYLHKSNFAIRSGVVKGKHPIELEMPLFFKKCQRVNIAIFPYTKGQYEGSPEELRDIMSQPSTLTHEDFDEFERLIEEATHSRMNE